MDKPKVAHRKFNWERKYTHKLVDDEWVSLLVDVSLWETARLGKQTCVNNRYEDPEITLLGLPVP